MTSKKPEFINTRKTLMQLYATHTGKVSDKWSSYLEAYERIFPEYRDKPISLLEIGVQNGGSLEIWADYFPRAKAIIGCDIDPACKQLEYDDPRIKVVIGDANSDITESEIRSNAKVFDIILDDGSHQSGDIIRSFARYFPHLADDGVYIVEDLHCSYWKEFGGGLYHPFSPQTFFKRLVDILNHEHWGIEKSRADILSGFLREHDFEISSEILDSIHSIQFMNSLCIIRKAPANRNSMNKRVLVGTRVDVLPDASNWNNMLSTARDQTDNQWTTRDLPPEEELTHRITELANRDEHINSLTQAVTERDERIAGLEARLAAIYASHSWRITAPLRAIRNNIRRISNRAWVERTLARIVLTRGPRAGYRLFKERRLLLSSGAFDVDYYRSQYPDIAASGIEPVLHYLLHGADEGRNPSTLFDTDWYLQQNQDAAEAGVNPLIHYIRFGAMEGRNPSTLFDTDWYLEQNPDVTEAGMNPLGHYLRFGASEGREVARCRNMPLEPFSYEEWIAKNDTLSDKDRYLIPSHISQFQTTRNLSKGVPYAYNDTRALVGVGAIFKNEAPYIIEWVAFHRAVGIERFFIADNNSEDGTTELLAALDEVGLVDHIPFPHVASEPPQLPAYSEILNRHSGDVCWIAFIDADEFLMPASGFRSITTVLESFSEDVGAVAVNWAIFGSSNWNEFNDRLVIERFINRARQDFLANHHYKSIIRPGACVAPKATPHQFCIKRDFWYCDVTGGAIIDHPLHGEGLTKSILWEPLRLNHYVVKSKDEFFFRKAPKGRATVVGLKRDEDYFSHHDRNEVTDPPQEWLVEATKKEIDAICNRLRVHGYRYPDFMHYKNGNIDARR